VKSSEAGSLLRAVLCCANLFVEGTYHWAEFGKQKYFSLVLALPQIGLLVRDVVYAGLYKVVWYFCQCLVGPNIISFGWACMSIMGATLTLPGIRGY